MNQYWIISPTPNEVEWGIYWNHHVHPSLARFFGGMMSGAWFKFASEFQAKPLSESVLALRHILL